MTRDGRKRWGLILAGGDGTRLRPLTRIICGDDRPKQFCPLFGGLTLLEHARQRAERSIPADQIVFSLSSAHEDFYLPLLWDCPSSRVVQPQNRGTLPAILSGLLTIAHKTPYATVAVFPSDHYYSNENIFTDSLDAAFDLVRLRPESVALLGARPHGPEVEYGWIESGASVCDKSDAFLVRGFHEKPPKDRAQILLEQGSLWNTFVMVGNIMTFLEMICSARPGILSLFQQGPSLRAPGEEVRLEPSLYERLTPCDFSRHVLSRETPRLMVQRLGPTSWSDLGDCDRAAEVLEHTGAEEKWAANWYAAKRVMSSNPVVATAVA